MTALRKPPRPKPRAFIKPRKGSFVLPGAWLDRDPSDLCGGRILTGREFKQRKAELEAREAKRGQT